MRLVACAALLSGCLIVRVEEDIVEDPCPTTEPQRLADTAGPFVVRGDSIYFIGANGTLSRTAIDGGPVSELTTQYIRATNIAADATDLYWATDDTIIHMTADGSLYTIAEGYAGITHLVVDDASVAWASSGGIDQWTKADETITHLDNASPLYGFGVSDGSYYFSNTHQNVVQRTPPTVTIAEAHSPGPLVVDAQGVYFYDVADPFAEHGGSIRLVPREGGAVVTTAEDISLVLDLASDEQNLYFVTFYATEYRIKQVSRFGGPVRTLACGSVMEHSVYIGVTADSVVWSDYSNLYRVPKYDASRL
jgi:hypothetical protein